MALLDLKSVYLAGTMSNQKNYGQEWRRKTQKWLEDRGLLVFNPCRTEAKMSKKYDVRVNLYNWEGLPQPMQEEIIERDLQQIEHRTKFMIVYYTKPSSGTTKEMVTAWRNKIPMFVVTSRRVRGWEGTAARAVTSKLFKTWEDLYNHLSYSLKLRKLSHGKNRKRKVGL